MTHTTSQNIPSKKSSLTPKICNSILGPRMLPEHIIEGVICIIECVGIVMAIGGSVLQSESKKTTNSYFFQHAPFPNVIYIFPIKLTMSIDFAFFMQKWPNTIHWNFVVNSTR